MAKNRENYSNDEPSLGDQASLAGVGPRSDTHSLGDGLTFGGSSGLEDPGWDEDLEVVDLAARYRTEKTLGRGGMGEVLLATDIRLNRKVAIKRILGQAARSRTAVQRFLKEAQSIAALNHPNIVQIYDYGRASDGPFLIMEYVEGDSLLDRCQNGGVSVEEAVELTCQICDGLSRAHEQGIIHRDIKPANILLTREGVPKLTDFGLAKVEAVDTGITMAGAVLGTLGFMPPEQRRDASLVDARSDLWSLAATLYQMVTGKVPTVIRLNDVPQSLQEVLSKSLEDAQDDRYQTAKEFKVALQASILTATTAFGSENVLGLGECPLCHEKNNPQRKFCSGCGASLRVPCLECGTELPLCEKFCGECGSSQEEILQKKQDALVAKSEEAERQLIDMNFEVARTLAHEILDVTDSRMQQLKPWADKFLTRIATSFQDASKRAQLCLQESLAHEAAFDYRSGIKALESVPLVLRQEACSDARESVGTVLNRLKSKQRRTDELTRSVRDRVQARQLSGLLADVQELSSLAPQRADITKLKNQLLEREAKQQQVRHEAFAEAEKQFSLQDYLSCQQWLSKIAPDFSDEKVMELHRRAGDCNDRAKELRARIQDSISQGHVTGLLELTEEYLNLRKNDSEVQKLHHRLLLQQQKQAEKEYIANVMSRKKRIWSYSLMGLGIAVIMIAGLTTAVVTLTTWSRAASKNDKTTSSTAKAQGNEGGETTDREISQGNEREVVADRGAEQGSEREVVADRHIAQTSIVNSIGMKLTEIPAGAFTMGEGRDAHRVTLTKPIHIGVHEVTQEQYQQLMGTNPSHFKGPRNPVDMVSWEDSVEFCRRLSELPEEQAAGRVYRLPTEAEWEYACRAGSTTKFSFGDNDGQLADYAWFSGNSGGKTHPVGQKKPNAWGLYDMHGNVWEWCADRASKYPKGAVIDPTGPSVGSLRMIRGGDWVSIAAKCRTANRIHDTPTLRNANLGFRLAMSPSESGGIETASQHDLASVSDAGKQDDVVQVPTPPNSLPTTREDVSTFVPEMGEERTTPLSLLTNSIGLQLKLLPAGKFTMGEAGAARQVTLSEPFYIGVYEVTQEQYEQVMGSNPSQFPGPSSPVEQVSWHDAVEFCKKLSELPEEQAAGRVYRLPTEAEWEYACRAGSTTKFSFGDNDGQLADYAWFSGNSGGKTRPVGQKKPNAWGLYDMHGNVWEWCSDWYGDLPVGATHDPVGPNTGSKRVNRGGSWDHVAENCRSALHNGHDPFHRGRTGFRIVARPYIEAPQGVTTKEESTRVLFGDDFQDLGFNPQTAALNPFDLATPNGPSDSLQWRFQLAGRPLRPLEKENLKWRSLRYSRNYQAYVIDDVVDVGSLVLTLRAESGNRTRIQGKLHLIDATGLKPFQKDLAAALEVYVETQKQAMELAHKQLKSTRAAPGEGGKKHLESQRLLGAMRECDRIQNVLAFAIEHNDQILESGLAFELVNDSAGDEVILFRSRGMPKNYTNLSSLTNSIGMRLVRLPSGTFTMGEGDSAHPVTLTKPFYMGIHEVTQEQYEHVMGDNPSQIEDRRNPVERVSWHEAVEFCKKLSELPEEKTAGRVYRLPTEAEWEYACRAGSTTKYSFGDDKGLLGDYAWFDENSTSNTHRVGQKKPNAWGLYDMHGNVWEWCADRAGAYPKGAVTDPVGPSQGNLSHQRRGGSFRFSAGHCESAGRSQSFPSAKEGDFGLRVALSPSEIPE